jgi:threonyl-tRNA synthetase
MTSARAWSFLSKGRILRSILEEFEKRLHLKNGYDIVYGPSLLRGKLWEISGIWTTTKRICISRKWTVSSMESNQ